MATCHDLIGQIDQVFLTSSDAPPASNDGVGDALSNDPSFNDGRRIFTAWERDNDEGRPCHAMIHERLFVCCLLFVVFVACVASGEWRSGQTKNGPIFLPKSSDFHRGISTCEVCSIGINLGSSPLLLFTMILSP